MAEAVIASEARSQIAEHGYILTPGRYVGAEESEVDGEPIETKIQRLRAEIEDGFEARAGLQERVLNALNALEAPE